MSRASHFRTASQEMRRRMPERNAESNRARILAGYCWNWPRARRADTNYHDIKIGNFEISWNLDGGEAFALSPASVNEAGCINTTRSAISSAFPECRFCPFWYNGANRLRHGAKESRWQRPRQHTRLAPPCS